MNKGIPPFYGQSSATAHPGSLIKLLIVDDEPLARSDLLRLCKRESDIQVVGEAESGVAAISAAEELRPDVMLLDVELPDMTGFDVLTAAGAGTRPLGIMVTAHSEHAVTAYAVGAIDCLVKPVTADRFARSIERAREHCDRAMRRLVQVLPQPQPARELFATPGARPKFLVGERQHRLYPLDPEKIDYIESDGNYVTIRTGNSEYISRDSIKRLAADLAHLGFVRIERSLLMNIKAVQYAETVGHGKLAFTLSSGACLFSSVTYREAILRVLPWHRCRGGSRRVDHKSNDVARD
jgi:two-component system LytT family response regulator